ncbi:MAG TPA: serine/threonine-protein kinase [Myxococcaceae bacterium]|nr:serine/threonine-protein kinase [Myxococcaceae bacterium]
MTRIVPTYRTAGPLLAGTRSSAMLGLEEREASARPVVLVWAPPDLPRDEDRFSQLQRDTRRAATLEHPHIVKVHGLATLEQGLARVVEYVDGESLRDVLEHTGKLSPAIAGRIAVDCALGVHYAHVAGNDDGTPLIHGDLRPETVMLAFSGRAKVGGYGALAVAPKEPKGQRVVNRRRYCAPEQIIGGRAAQTSQTDVFLLGLVLYECLTGRMPWDRETDFDQAVMTSPLPVEGLPPPVQELLRKATAKRASDRHKTALAFRDAVDQVFAPLATPAQLSELLEHHFPAQDSPRAARKQVLDAALAAHARAWASQAPKASEAPTIPIAQRELAELEKPAFDWRSKLPLVFGVAVAGALAAAFWFQTRHAVPKPMLLVPPGQEQAAGAVPAAAGTPRTPPAATPGTGPAAPAVPPPAVAAVSPPPAPASQPALAPASPVKPAAGARSDFLTTGLDLVTDPPVDVALDKKPFGRTPIVIPATPGRHVLTLSDTAKGISQSRVVTVKKDGVTPLRLTVGRGTLSVRAPQGARVFVDGRVVGSSPIDDLHLFEGTHHLKVTLGDAIWQQSFVLRSEQSLRYDVELKPTNGG